MPESWPLTLQQKLNEANFSFTKGDTVLRSDMEVGPSKVRRRYTTSIDEITGSITVNVSEFNIFENFFETTLEGGSKSFYFNHPITGVQGIFRFKGAYKTDSLGGGIFQIKFNWEIL